MAEKHADVLSRVRGNIRVVAHSGMEAYRSMDPPGNYLFGFSVRLGGHPFCFYFMRCIYFSLHFEVLVNGYQLHDLAR